MNVITLLSAQSWVERLGWTLLHFVLQGVLISALYAAARRAARSSSPNSRYLLACFALAALAAAPLLTWGFLQQQVPLHGPAHPEVASPAAAAAVTVTATSLVRETVYRTLPDPFFSWVVAVWLAGSIVFWIRLIGGWAFAIRLRSTFVRPAPAEWQEVLDRLMTRIRVSYPVRLLVSSLAQAPMVVGWLRPVVLVPVGALAGLPPEQMEALLIHELAHIRRGDYLVNILQSIAEAVLFYHPAVWWISAHIRAERELCCDDVAVSLTGDALTYARALAELEASRSTRIETALAATGGPLARRVARLLGQPFQESRRIAGPEILSCAVLLAVSGVVLFGQSAARPKFEVASVKPSSEQRFMMVRPLPGGRLTATAPVRLLIQNAYSLQAFQIVGGPGWIDSDRYEIEAKADGNASRAEVLQMLQSLLEDRFQLKTHHETRELPVYALVTSKSGSKLPPPKEGNCVKVNPDAPPPPPGRGGMVCGRAGIMGQASGARIAGGELEMPEFVRILSIVMGRTVIDKTGINTKFDVQLDFTIDAITAGLISQIHQADPGGAPPPSDPATPSILSAIQEQLGLKLESAKGPVDVLVIDHVQRPSVN